MNGGNSGNPWRGTFPGGTFAYGCPPVDTPFVPPSNPFDVPPGVAPVNPFDLRSLKPEMWALAVCTKCQRHVRTGEPCPWCLRAELDALKIALERASASAGPHGAERRGFGDKAKPVEEIAKMRDALRLAVDTLREVSRVVGSSRLDEVIAQCERALTSSSSIGP